MRVLLTGGFGYVGGRLAQDLTRSGIQVVLGSRRIVPPPEWLPAAEVTVTEWSSRSALVAACKDIDAVIHLAGMNAANCVRDPAGALQVNGVQTAELVGAAIEAKVRKFIYFSTAHVYASSLSGNVSEATCPSNLHPYATSHRAGEDAVRFANSQMKIEGLVIRLSNGYGAPALAQADCWTLVANDLARQLATTGAFALNSPGHQLRDFVALTDVGRIVLALLSVSSRAFNTGVVNVGGGLSMSILSMAERIGLRYEALVGRKPVLTAPPATSTGQQDEFCYDLSALRQAGIALPSSNSIDAEIDGLLRFCIDTFG